MKRMCPCPAARLPALLLLCAVAWAGAAAPLVAPPAERPLRVLFVGNSYTFYNNLPQVFVAVARAAHPGRPAPEVELVAAGGATLDDLLGLPRFDATLRRGPWDVVVLQERGGLLACLTTMQRPVPTDCAASVGAHRKMIKAARAAGARSVLLFGTWQMGTREAGAASRGTRKLAGMLDVPMLDLAAMLFAAARADPGSRWFTADDHPHRLGSLLMASALWSKISGEPPPALPFDAEVPEYTGYHPLRRRAAAEAAAPRFRLQADQARMQVIARAIAAGRE
jgi:hypothetical protein